jgi:hypothetical protein
MNTESIVQEYEALQSRLTEIGRNVFCEEDSKHRGHIYLNSIELQRKTEATLRCLFEDSYDPGAYFDLEIPCVWLDGYTNDELVSKCKELVEKQREELMRKEEENKRAIKVAYEKHEEKLRIKTLLEVLSEHKGTTTLDELVSGLKKRLEEK